MVVDLPQKNPTSPYYNLIIPNGGQQSRAELDGVEMDPARDGQRWLKCHVRLEPRPPSPPFYFLIGDDDLKYR